MGMGGWYMVLFIIRSVAVGIGPGFCAWRGVYGYVVTHVCGKGDKGISILLVGRMFSWVVLWCRVEWIGRV